MRHLVNDTPEKTHQHKGPGEKVAHRASQSDTGSVGGQFAISFEQTLTHMLFDVIVSSVDNTMLDFGLLRDHSANDGGARRGPGRAEIDPSRK